MVYPIITERSQGSRIWDVDGNEYIDIVNGFGPIMLGHRPDFVENAIAKQLSEGFETGPQSPLAGKVAQLFCEMTGNERMTFCNTGSEAVLAALRVARTVTGRNKVVSFAGDYHGLFDEVLVKGIRNKAGEPQAAPVAPGIPRESVANMVVLDYGEAESLEWIRKNAKDLAAVLVEPVQSRHPDLQPIEFLKELRDITQKSGTALVFDEVVTGFRVHGRTPTDLYCVCQRSSIATNKTAYSIRRLCSLAKSADCRRRPSLPVVILERETRGLASVTSSRRLLACGRIYHRQFNRFALDRTQSN